MELKKHRASLLVLVAGITVGCADSSTSPTAVAPAEETAGAGRVSASVDAMPAQGGAFEMNYMKSVLDHHVTTIGIANLCASRSPRVDLRQLCADLSASQ